MSDEQQQIEALKRDIASKDAAILDLWEENKRMRDVLRQVQWGNTIAGRWPGELLHMCPLCDQVEGNGHTPDCLVGMCLEPKAAKP